MASDKRTGMAIPAGILAPTTPRENPPESAEAEQGGSAPVSGDEAISPEPKGGKLRRKKAGGPTNDKLEGRRLYLSEDVHFRLRMLAYQRGRKISEVAQEVLDKALPKYDVNRVG